MTHQQSREGGERSLVMHVEDDPVVLAAMRTLLTAEGYEVLSFAQPKAAEEAIESGARPELLIADYHLGDEESGTELAERIATRLDYPLPIILLTGDPANCEVPWLTRAPVWLLPKPPDMRILVAGIGPLTQFTRATRARRPLPARP